MFLAPDGALASVRIAVPSGDVLALLAVNDVASVVAIFGLLRSGCAAYR